MTAQCRSSTGLLTVFFTAEPPRDYCRPPPTPGLRRLVPRLLARGVYAPPSQFEAWFPSAHDGEHIAHGRGRGGRVRRG